MRPRHLFPAVAACLAALAIGTTPATADDGVVTVPQGSPAGREYAVPLQDARDLGGARDTAAAAGSADDPDAGLFGAGVGPATGNSSGASRNDATDAGSTGGDAAGRTDADGATRSAGRTRTSAGAGSSADASSSASTVGGPRVQVTVDPDAGRSVSAAATGEPANAALVGAAGIAVFLLVAGGAGAVLRLRTRPRSGS